MRGKPSILLAMLGLVLVACSPAGSAPDGHRAPVPREVVLVGAQDGPLTVEVPGGSVLFERPGALASPDGSRLYSASVVRGRTVLVTDDSVSGLALSRVSVPGEHELAVVSGSGGAAALVEPLPEGGDPTAPVPRANSTITVADPTGRTEARTYRLEGNYAPEAFSVDDTRLFLLQFLPAEAPVAYRVRMLDLSRRKVFPVYGPFKDLAGRMPGTRLEQVLAPDAARLYTLYSSARPGYAPHGAPASHDASVSFVHVLDLRDGWAHCVGLPKQLWDRPAAEQAMAVSPDGATLYVVDPAQGVVTAMDTDTLETRVVDGIVFGAAPNAEASAQVSADGRTLYVTAAGASPALFALDTVSLALEQHWPLDLAASSLGLSTDGRRLYAANGHELTVVDPRTGSSLLDVPLAATGPVVRLSPITG